MFVFSAQGGGDGATVYSRMFAPDAGVVEDPATGSASGPLGAYLVRHGIVAIANGGHIVSAQGVKMGRPSRLHVRVEATAAREVTRVHVGGARRACRRGHDQLVSTSLSMSGDSASVAETFDGRAQTTASVEKNCSIAGCHP